MSTTPHRALQTEPLFCFQVKVHDPCFLPSLSLQDFCSERLDALVTDVRASTIILPEESEVDDHATTAPVSSTPASPATANRASRIPVAVPALPQCRALYPYSKSQEDEIELQCVILIFLAMFSPGTFSRLTLIPTVPLRREGDVIDILSSEDEVWWHGRCNGIEGLFPATYVERI
eukprot:m.237328 g.237328  ORF g.237328 m.237328 type:complete len:176 (-) comp54333_c0_seq3:172-699(-)